jgi:diaminobutyrate acetyltransferase
MTSEFTSPAPSPEGEDDDTRFAASFDGMAALKTTAAPAARTELAFRRPTYADGKAMWELTRDTGVLDLNSSYAYLMMAKWYADSCVVAEEIGRAGRRMVGFVIGFVPPRQPDTIFVWQVGVCATQRGRGMGKKLLRHFVDGAPREVRYLEATVTPSNRPSEQLFRSFAQASGTQVRVEECFPAHAFPGEGHEPERLFRIGPLLRAV